MLKKTRLLVPGLICALSLSVNAEEIPPLIPAAAEGETIATPACAPGCTDSCAPDGCTQTACGDDANEHSIMKLFGDHDMHGITLGGWGQYGYYSRNNNLFFDNAQNQRFNLNQSWIYAEKAADGSDGLDWGFRVDLMYGTDADDTNSFGNHARVFDFNPSWNHGIYGFAMPQLYGELAMGNTSVKVGHFYTLVGYEVVTAPDNFFYSHAYTMFNNEPFTHTGVLASTEVSDNLTVHAGWTLGWDTGFDSFNGGSSFLGGASVKLSDDATITYIATAGNFGRRGTKGYGHSIVLDVTLTEDLNLILQSDFVDTNGAPLAGARDQNYGVNSYLIYSINKWLAAGGRFEWFNAGGFSVYQATAGINIKPMGNIIIRPEIRHDWGSAAIAALPGGFTTFACDCILTY